MDLQELLETGLVVTLRVNVDDEDIEIPEYLREDPRSFHFMGSDYNFADFDIGYNTAVPIPDLEIAEDGIYCTLSFNRVPFPCFFPHSSIIGYGGPAVEKAKEDLKPKLKSIEGGGSEPEEKQETQKKKPEDGKRKRPDWLRVVK